MGVQGVLLSNETTVSVDTFLCLYFVPEGVGFFSGLLREGLFLFLNRFFNEEWRRF